jgi:hypothetical protein
MGERSVRLALLVGILLLIPAGAPSRLTVTYMLVLGVVLALSLKWRTGLLAVVALFVAGVHLRVGAFGTGSSDVLAVTSAAIDLVAAGGNPYGHGYASSVPPGAPFAYGPLSLLWYAPFGDLRVVEMVVAFVVLVALALRGRPLGLAVYALAPTLISTASDGSNDTSAGALILVALVAAIRWPRAGALLLAVAVAFKPYAAAWLVPLVAWSGIGVLLPFLAATAVLWSPLVVWGPGAFLTSLRMAEEVHPSPSFSLAYALGVFDRGRGAVFETLRLAAGLAVAALTAPFVRSGHAVIVSGGLIFLATLYTGYWSTFAYLSALAPVLCWHLDGWLGMADERVVLPGDAAGRLSATLDRRWPTASPETA